MLSGIAHKRVLICTRVDVFIQLGPLGLQEMRVELNSFMSFSTVLGSEHTDL